MKTSLGFDLILLGDPASGKDTQAKLLERKFLLKPVESGDYLRGLMRNQTKLGSEVRAKLLKGLPAPSHVIREFLEANVRLAPKKGNLVFVGNPRLKPEAEYLSSLLSSHQRDFLVIFLKVSDAEVWKRSAKRLRNADDSRYVRTRIAWTKSRVAKTVDYFKKIKKIRIINGTPTIKEVNKEILKAILEYKKSKRA